MKKILVLATFVSLLTFVKAQQEASGVMHRFNLEQCLAYAFNHNYNRQSFQLSEKATEDSYRQSMKERLPSMSASLNESLSSSKSNSPSWNGNYGISTGVTLYQGGNITNTIEQNQLRMEQSPLQTSQYENDLTIRILQAFLSVLGNEELLKYQKAVVIASEEQLKQGRSQYEVGTILESDYLLLEAQSANDKNNIADTEISRSNNLIALKSLLSMEPGEDLEIISPDTAYLQEMALLPPMDYVLQRAQQTMPDIRISDYNVEIAKVGVKLSRSGYFPTVNLNGSIGTRHIDDYSNFGTQLSDALNEQIGVSVSIPIFDNGRTKSRVTQSKIALQQAELDRKQTELDILQSVATEYQNIIAAYNKCQTTDIRQNAYLKTFNAYRAQFDAGAITAVDLLQQQNNYISALSDYIQSKYEFILNRKILDVYTGEPVKM